MIPFNLTSTPAGLKRLQHEASTPGYSYYSEAAAALAEALDRCWQRYESFVSEAGIAMDCMEDVVAELNDLCDAHDMPSTLQEALRGLADRLEKSVVDLPGDPDE
jgi:cytochrome c556